MSGAARESDPIIPGEPAGASVGVVGGDRLCAGCGFNLHGQTIVREPHYRALIVRCPECGMAAALQEYPLLGRWAGRLAALLAAAWLAGMIFGVVLSAAILYALCDVTISSASARLTETIGQDYLAWQSEMIEQHKGDPNAPSTLAKYPWLSDVLSEIQGGQGASWGPYYVDPAWWEEQDHGAVLRRTGGLAGAVVAAGLTRWVLCGAVALAIGAVMSVALLHQPPRRVAMLAVIPLAAGALAMLHFTPEPNPGWGTNVYWTSIVASSVLWLRLGALALGVYALCLVLGIFVGRPLIRAMIRGAIPPRLRGPLTFLWTAKGLPPPRTRQ